VLEQLQHDYEGFGAGAVAVLKGNSSVIGSLTDKIKVPDQYVAALEAALGSNLQLVLTENPDAAQQILAELSVGKKGTASITALGLLKEIPPPEVFETTPANCTSALSTIE